MQCVDSKHALLACAPARFNRSRFPAVWRALREEESALSVAMGSRMLTVGEVCVELQISRSTFYDWRQKGRGPRCVRLPNGSLRVRRRDIENWLVDCENSA